MIRVTHLTKMYGQRAAIDDLSFHVQKGEIVGFLGPNGAGKSTTMKIITGFMPATQGDVSVAGLDAFTESTEMKKHIGYLPETPPIYMELQVDDYLEYAARLHGVPSAKISSAISKAVEKTNLGDVRKRLIGNLSKGYKQRVGLAQALIHDPAVLVLDEPTVGLDPKQIIEIRELIRSLRGDHTIILSSHILPEVTATCGRIIVINKGKIVAEDTMEGLTLQMRKGLFFYLVVQEAKAAATQAFQQLSGVQKVTVAGNKYIIEVAPNQANMQEKLVKSAVEQGLSLMEFGSERVSLEEIFLQLTTDEKSQA